jgi:hypothetical protein
VALIDAMEAEMKRLLFWYVACGMLSAVPGIRYAQAAAQADVLKIDNGENRLTLDGQPALVVRAWRENYNAHGFDVVTFYVRAKDGAGASLQLLPLFAAAPGDGKERYEITTSRGADCQLRDFRLVRDPSRQSTRLIVAEREFGDAFTAPGIVHFTDYDLVRNADGVPGWPPLYFKAGRRTDSQQTYCDVNEAFDKELHLGRTSGNGGHDRGEP